MSTLTTHARTQARLCSVNHFIDVLVEVLGALESWTSQVQQGFEQREVWMLKHVRMRGPGTAQRLIYQFDQKIKENIMDSLKEESESQTYMTPSLLAAEAAIATDGGSTRQMVLA